MIDSNIIIRYLAGLLPGSAQQQFRELTREKFSYSVITEMEVLGYPFEDKEDERNYVALLKAGIRLPVIDPVIAATIAIRKTRKIKLPDAIIAATSLVHGLELWSDNERDFAKIDGLRLITTEVIIRTD